MLIILTDVQITRRKRVHMIVNTAGELRYAAPSLDEAFTWIADQGETEVIIEAGSAGCYRIHLRPIPPIISRHGRPEEAAG